MSPPPTSGDGCRIPTHSASASPAAESANASKRENGAGRRPGLLRTSQLRVKLGTMRPPISIDHADDRGDGDAYRRSRPTPTADQPRRARRRCRSSSTPSTPSTRRLRQLRPGDDLAQRHRRQQDAGRRYRWRPPATAPIDADIRIAIRPASHSSARPASGAPQTGSRPVQFGMAVRRKPAMTAAT